jgi:hypothetical protein
MRLNVSFIHVLRKIRFPLMCCLTLLAFSIPLRSDDAFLGKAPTEWTEAEALQVLNDSPWARPVVTTVQESQCNFEHPAFPGLFPEDDAQLLDLRSPIVPASEVKPDGAEYVVRLVSVKPMQSAVERLLNLGEKWNHYRRGIGVDPGSRPTNVEERWYNPADEIAIAVALKRPGPDGASFTEYAFGDKYEFPKRGFHVFPCSAIKTPEGQAHAVIAGVGFGPAGATAIELFFPSFVNGKPLISRPNEPLQFRMIANQHVFDTTFVVSPADLLDGSERVIRIPPTVDEITASSSH